MATKLKTKVVKLGNNRYSIVFQTALPLRLLGINKFTKIGPEFKTRAEAERIRLLSK